jgi:hypothetical protein
MRRNKYIYITLLAVLSFNAEGAVAQDSIRYAPRLIVNITIDQLRTDYLEAFAPVFGKDGFKRLFREGLVYENASYPFTKIDRASAISSVITGVSPYYHSIVGEKWLDKESLRPVGCTEDIRQPGVPSPTQLMVSTLGDELKVATDGAAKIFTISPTSDAAVLSAGHAADGAFWIDDRTGLWTGSKYYSNEIPHFLLAFNELKSPSAKIKKAVWQPAHEISGTFNYYQHIGDQKPFKHVFNGERKFIEYKTSGLINADITELAQQCVISQAMGYDRVTDLLCLTYYAGNYDHKAMTDCQMELQDTYMRLDQELGRLIKALEDKLGKEHVMFVLTSTGYSDAESTDYGKYRVPTGVFYINRTANLLNMYFGAIWGQGRYVETCFSNEIYLNHKLLESKRISLTDATQRAQEFISQMSGVRNVYTFLQLLGGNNQQIYMIRNGFNPEHNGDILIEVSPGWEMQNENTQEKQLSRASFTQFPLIIFGAGTKAERIKTPITIDRIAPTIAKTIRIRAPNACSSEPLF